jgi:hypothetical protein
MKKQRYTIEIVADDGKSIKKVEVEAKSAAAALGMMAKEARTSDHAIKGVGQQSSNSTKNFSKMSEVLSSGIVPAYATLAAQLFAVSAGFEFLKRSGDLQVLREGQVAYASATGTAIRSLANDLIAATDAQINFTDASQGAAIASAAGLTADQITAIGTAAKNTSIILGRDVTDSFNRLVRGITKAEPELLDELGIILRLETATEKYANAIGKHRLQLTAWERSQAVANEVLGQAEEKYNKIIDIVDPSVNQFNQLGKAVDDVLMQLKLFTAWVAGPLAKVLTEMPSLVFLGVGALLKGPLMALMPGISQVTERAATLAENAKKRFDDMSASAQKAARMTKDEFIALKKSQALENLQPLTIGRTFRAGSAFESIQQGKVDSLTSQQITGMRTAIQRSAGQFKDLTDSQKIQYTNALDSMLMVTRKNTSAMELEFNKFGASVARTSASIQLRWAQMTAAMTKGFQTALMWGSRLLSLIGSLSLWATLGFVIYDLIRTREVLSDSEKEAKRLEERLASLREEFELFNRVQNAMNEGTQRTLGFLEAFGRRIGSLIIADTSSLFRMFDEEALKTVNSELESVARRLGSVRNEIQSLQSIRTRDREGLLGTALQAARDQEARLVAISEAGFSGIVKEKGTPAQKEFILYLEELVESLETSTDAYARNTPVFRDYIASIKEFLDKGPSEGLIKNILRQQSEIAELTQILGGLARQQSENIDLSTKLIKSFMPDTEFDKAIVALSNEYTDLMTVLATVTQLGEEEYKLRHDRMVQIDKEIALFRGLNEQEHRNNLIKERTKAMEIRAGIGATSGQAALLKQEYERIRLEQERNELMQQQDLIRARMTDVDLQTAERTLAINNEKLQTLDAQLEVLDRQQDKIYQIIDGANQAFETGLQSGLASLIKGEETSLKDAMLQLARTTIGSIGDTLAKQITDTVMGRNPIQIAGRQAQIISGSFIAAGQQVAATISAALMGTPVTTITRGGLGPAMQGTARMGGIIPFLTGLLTPYADGGIVNKPTPALIGEGRYNEAVVPLPDGKRIPVDLGRSSSQSNNIEINITMDSAGNASGTTTNGMDPSMLGNAIAKAVQRELQNQKRSGGILSPYGTA